MKYKKTINIIILLLILCLLSSIALFIYNADNSYEINSGFTFLPLDYNAEDSTSSYNYNDVDITAYGGFIKGIQKNEDGTENLVIRALSPLVSVQVKNNTLQSSKVLIQIENINPDFYSKSIEKAFNPVRISVNTLSFTVNLNANEIKSIKPQNPIEDEEYNYVILGDSRNGYDTFGQIISRVNELNPIFVIDNGDLVYNGKQNQYRLFDQMAARFSTTLCTTLGNHDIRYGGKDTYTKLYGPAYYSFDFGSNHFIFLDSSKGWVEKKAISDEQYSWLKKDLEKSQGKNIYIITHVPPTDPRSNKTPNELPAYIDKLKKEGDDNYVEQMLDKYTETESMDHGFQDKSEAEYFENLMSQYHVKTVYLSHIHSYFDYTIKGVRYIISGGAGAELLTENSYYHYLISKTDSNGTITMVEMPSPKNTLVQRYVATIALFSESLYKENRLAVTLIINGLILLLFLLLIKLYIRYSRELKLFGILIKDTGSFVSQKSKDLFKHINK